MPTNRIAENFFGTLGQLSMYVVRATINRKDSGTVCWTFQLLPQIMKSWRERSTYGLSPWLV
jgi:hypothetical protein